MYKRDPILPLNSPRIQTCNTVIYIFNIRITIWMLHPITKWLEIYIETSEVDPYTSIFTSRIFKLALEKTFLLKKNFFLQIAYELLSKNENFVRSKYFLVNVKIFTNNKHSESIFKTHLY